MSFYTDEDWLRDACESIRRLGLPDRIDVTNARTIDFITRKDAVERRYQGDWIKYIVRGLPALERLLVGAPSHRDSVSRSGSRDNLLARAEGRQSGGEAASPNNPLKNNPHISGD